MGNLFEAIRFTLLLVGLLIYFVVQRYFSSEALYTMMIGVGYISVFVSFVPLFITWQRASKNNYSEKAEVVVLSICWQFFLLLGIILHHLYSVYFSSVDQVTWSSSLMLGSWLSIVVLSITAGIGIELGVHNSGNDFYADSALVRRYGVRWLNVGLLLMSLVGFNYVGSKSDKVFDLSYLKVTEPSQGTLDLIGGLDKSLKFEVFFPYDSDVLSEVNTYLEKLPSDKVEIERLDKDINPREAEESKVSRNGQIVLKIAEKTERISVGNTRKKAKKVLRKLDRMVQKAIQELSARKKIVYFTRDHGEMQPYQGESDLRKIRQAEALLKSQNFIPKSLDGKTGLFQKVPNDASLVIVAAPSLPFTLQEVDVLEDYVTSGGALFLLFDDEFVDGSVVGSQGSNHLKALIKKFGVGDLKGRLANEKKFVRATKTKADKWFLHTNVFGSHPAVESLSKHDNKLRILLRNSSALSVSKVKGWKVDELVKSFGDSFLDVNLNTEFDKDAEKRSVYPFSVAAESQVNKGRVIVVADGTTISDLLMANNAGNQVMFLDSVRWLTGDESIVSSQNSEEDVHLIHRKNEHLTIFYGSGFVVPSSILIFGFIATRRKHSKNGGSSDA